MASGLAAPVNVPYQAKSESVIDVARRVLDHDVLEYVVDRKSIHTHLRGDVQELSHNPPREVGLTAQRRPVHRSVRRPRIRVDRIVIDAGQFDEREHAEDHQHNAPEHHVRSEQSGKVHRRSGFVSFAEDQRAPHRGRDDVSHRIESLRHRKSGRRAVLGPEHSDVGICRRLDAGQAAGQDEQGKQEGPKRLEPKPGRNEQESARRDDDQSQQDALLIADPPDQQRRWKSQQEIGPEDRGLDESRLRLAHVQNVLKVLVQNIEHCMAESPYEKQGGDHDESEQQRVVRSFGGVHHLWLWLYRQSRTGRKSGSVDPLPI